MGTLLAREYPALSEMDPSEASFLGTLLPDLLRTARKSGTAHLAFHEYDLFAQRESLGAVLVAVTWIIRRHGTKIASDTAILCQ